MLDERRVKQLLKGANSGDVELVLAAINTTKKQVKSLLVRRFKHGATALHIAAAHGHISVARVLLESGANQHLADKSGRLPIHSAAMQGKRDVVNILLLCCRTRQEQLLLIGTIDDNAMTPAMVCKAAEADWNHAGVGPNFFGRRSFLHAIARFRMKKIARTKAYIRDFAGVTSILSMPPAPQGGTRVANDMNRGVVDFTFFSGRAKSGSLNGLRTHKIWRAVLPKKSHQFAIAKAAAHCPALHAQLEKATTIEIAQRMLNVLRPCLNIGSYSSLFQTKAIDDASVKEAARRAAEELRLMMQEDAMGRRARAYLTEDNEKLRKLRTLFSKLAHPLAPDGRVTPTDLMSAERFARLSVAIGELLRPEQIAYTLQSLVKLAGEASTSYPPSYLSFPQFVIWWLAAEREERLHYGLTKSAENTQIISALPDPRGSPDPSVIWLRRLRARARLDEGIGSIRACTSEFLDAAAALNAVRYSPQKDSSNQVHGVYYLMRSAIEIPWDPPVRQEDVVMDSLTAIQNDENAEKKMVEDKKERTAESADSESAARDKIRNEALQTILKEKQREQERLVREKKRKEEADAKEAEVEGKRQKLLAAQKKRQNQFEKQQKKDERRRQKNRSKKKRRNFSRHSSNSLARAVKSRVHQSSREASTGPTVSNQQTSARPKPEHVIESNTAEDPQSSLLTSQESTTGPSAPQASRLESETLNIDGSVSAPKDQSHKESDEEIPLPPQTSVSSPVSVISVESFIPQWFERERAERLERVSSLPRVSGNSGHLIQKRRYDLPPCNKQIADSVTWKISSEFRNTGYMHAVFISETRRRR